MEETFFRRRIMRETEAVMNVHTVIPKTEKPANRQRERRPKTSERQLQPAGEIVFHHKLTKGREVMVQRDISFSLILVPQLFESFYSCFSGFNMSYF